MKLSFPKLRIVLISGFLVFVGQALMAADGNMPAVAGIRIEFILFALTLIGVAVFHDSPDVDRLSQSHRCASRICSLICRPGRE